MALLSTASKSNWNLKMLVFVEGGNPEYLEVNPRSRDENQQQSQPTYDSETGNRTPATLVGGECSHLCAIPAPTTDKILLIIKDFFVGFDCFISVKKPSKYIKKSLQKRWLKVKDNATGKGEIERKTCSDKFALDQDQGPHSEHFLSHN